MNLKVDFKKDSFINNFIVLFSSNFLLLFIGFGSSILLTRFLSPDNFGYFSSINYYVLFFVSICEIGIKQSTIHFSGKDIFSLSELVPVNLFVWIFSSLFGFAAFVCLLSFKDILVSNYLLVVCFFYISITILNSFSDGFMYSIGKVKTSSRLQLLNGIIKILGYVIFVILLKISVIGAFLSIALAQFFTCISKLNLIKNTINDFSFSLDFQKIKMVFNKGFFYSISLFLSANQKTIPIIIMTGIVSSKNIAIFSVAMVFTTLLNKLYASISPLIFIKSSKSTNNKKNSDDIHKLLRVVISLLIVVCVLSYFFLEDFVILVYGVNYEKSASIALILFVGVIFYNIYLILNMNISGSGDNKTALFCLIPGTVINLVLNYFLINNYDIYGAAVATSFSRVIISLVFIFLYSNKTNCKVKSILLPQKQDYSFIKKII